MNKTAFLGMVVSVFALVSCGGQTNYIPSNIVLPGNPQLYTGNVTYLAGTEEYNAFNAINAFRASVGLGYWNQSIYLDQAAASHMAYSVANCKGETLPLQFMDDIETDNCSQFTGITPSARAIAKGFYILENTTTQLNVPTAAVGELYSVGSGSSVVDAMVNTIYHRSGLMEQSTRYVGLARNTAGPVVAGTTTYWWISHGKLDSGQSVASNYLGRYPIDQQTGVPLHMCPEYPSVYSNTTIPNFSFEANTSSPVSLTTSTLIQLTTTNVTVTPSGSSTPLDGKIWTMYNDPNLNTTNESLSNLSLSDPPPAAATITANQVFWVGSAPFQPNTTYTVTVTGSTFLTAYAITNPLTVTWTFTTGTSTTCE